MHEPLKPVEPQKPFKPVVTQYSSSKKVVVSFLPEEYSIDEIDKALAHFKKHILKHVFIDPSYSYKLQLRSGFPISGIVLIENQFTELSKKAWEKDLAQWELYFAQYEERHAKYLKLKKEYDIWYHTDQLNKLKSQEC